jgi:membrane-associated phospholipid phosphatase
MKGKYFNYKSTDFNLSSLFVLVGSLFLVLIAFVMTSRFLIFNESRLGFQLFDPVLMILPEFDLSRVIFITTYSSIALGLLFSFNSLQSAIAGLQAMFILLILRIICMSLVPLEPPIDIIPLQDDFLSGTFYDGRVLLKDLFFSGHTASIALLAFLIQDKGWSRIILMMSMIVGTMLIMQHVHYTLDVICAYMFAYLACSIGVFTAERSLLLGRYASIHLSRKSYYRN